MKEAWHLFPQKDAGCRCAHLVQRYGLLMKLCCALVPFLALFGTALAADAPKMGAAEAAKLVAQGKAVLVDCREPKEWQETGVASPAVLLPKSDFDGDQKQWTEFLARHQDKQVLVYCRSGRRSGAIANALAKKG